MDKKIFQHISKHLSATLMLLWLLYQGHQLYGRIQWNKNLPKKEEKQRILHQKNINQLNPYLELKQNQTRYHIHTLSKKQFHISNKTLPGLIDTIETLANTHIIHIQSIHILKKTSHYQATLSYSRYSETI